MVLQSTGDILPVFSAGTIISEQSDMINDFRWQSENSIENPGRACEQNTAKPYELAVEYHWENHSNRHN